MVAIQGVTVGPEVTELIEKLEADGEFAEQLFVHGLGVQAAEGLAEWLHSEARRELGIDPDQGRRYSWGYPACPEQSEHEKVWRLLGLEEIGMTLSDGYAVMPEQSTVAIIAHHPQAVYFGMKSGFIPEDKSPDELIAGTERGGELPPDEDPERRSRRGGGREARRRRGGRELKRQHPAASFEACGGTDRRAQAPPGRGEHAALELEGEGPPLILLHGFADSADTWRLLLDRLRKQGRAAVALDMPGFGQAEHLDPARPVLEQLDGFADAAIETLGRTGRRHGGAGRQLAGRHRGDARRRARRGRSHRRAGPDRARGARDADLVRRDPGGAAGEGDAEQPGARTARRHCSARSAAPIACSPSPARAALTRASSARSPATCARGRTWPG